jgi:hypothetical protein
MRSIIFLLLFSPKLFAQHIEWQSSTTSNGYSDIGQLAIDDAGNSYACGVFNGITDFDPGQGTNTILSGNNTDYFIWKLDKNGALDWAGTIPNSGLMNADGIQIHADNSYLYVCCDAVANADIDFSSGTHINPIGWLLAQYDSDGGIRWLVTFGQTVIIDKPKITTNQLGQVIFTGLFKGTLDCDPGPQQMILSATNYTIFTCILDANGNFVRAFKTVTTNELGDFSLDNYDNQIYAISIYDQTDLDPGPAVYTLPAGLAVVKFDPYGNLIWAFSYPNNSQTTFILNDIAVAADGRIAVCGYFGGTDTVFDMDPDPNATVNVPSSENPSVALVVFDQAGNYSWVQIMRTEQFIYLGYCTFDGQGNLRIAGDFMGSYITIGRTTHAEQNGGLYAGLFDRNGNNLQSFTETQTGHITFIPRVIKTDQNGDWILSGNADRNVSIVRLHSSHTGDSAGGGINIYPSPATDQVQLVQNRGIDMSNATVSVYDSRGKLVFEDNINSPSAGYTLYVKGYSSGIYYVNIYNTSGSYSNRFVKQ